MKISMTQKEYGAILSVLDHIITDYESASDENFIEQAEEDIALLNDIIEKYNKAVYKAAVLKEVRKFVAEKNTGISQRDIDKKARKLLRKIEKDYPCVPVMKGGGE